MFYSYGPKMRKPTYKDLESRIRQLESEVEHYRRNLSSDIQGYAPTLESDEKYRIIFDNLTEAVALHRMILDRDGNIIDFTYEDMNPARERMINRTYEQIKKMTVLEANPDVDASLMQAYGRTALTGEPLSYEFHSEVYNRDLVVKQFSHKYGYVGTIIEDVTAQKKSEEKLKINEKRLRQLNLTKDRLFSIIAHDLRGPFNSIIGYSRLLRDNFRNYTAEETERYLDTINSSAQNTFNLLVNLLSWAKNQTGQTTFSPEILKLKKITDEAVDLFKASADTKNISINSNIAGDLNIYADKNMLRTIMQNLISNAIKFTHSGGEINIFASASGGNAEITISDNGIGISKKALKNLFELATANSTNGTSNETGSGLGLVLCREFVEKHGGKIWVEGKPGKGTDFKFTIPMPD